MKKNIYFIILLFVCSNLHTYAIGPLDFGVRFGLSTPNDEIANIYNADEIKLNDSTTSSFLNNGLDAGYHLGVRLRFNIPASSFSVVGGLGLHRFPQTKIMIDETEINTSILIVPVTADLQYQLLDFKVVDFYLQGGLSYNQIMTSIDFNGIPLPIQDNLQETSSDSRIGGSIGAGMDISLVLLSINVFADYNLTNIMGRDNNENSKEFLAVGIGVYF